ncbi:SH3 domain-containing protein [Streptomyces sp. YC504]|uniref:SH3 domain-containing protein n=2 Tax=Streptomyces mesophilus TaxID=1775132 RepID=A0A6G4XG07_9ACTN|nr:SH3 domain-containing protein [Streptomyces mesophilus]
MVTSAPAHAYAPCGKKAPDKDSSSWRATADGVNMRSGSSTGCSINGYAGSTDKMDYHCQTEGAWSGGSAMMWTYARNVRTGVEGWMRTDTLDDFGSQVDCGF